MLVVLATWRALAAPRRAIPLALVLVALAATEWLATHSFTALAIDLSLFLAFFAIAPAAWRLFCSTAGSSAGRVLAGHAAYVASCALVVAMIAVALPRAIGADWTFVLHPSAIGVVLVLFAVGGWGLGRDVDLEEGYVAARDRAGQLAIEAERSELLALRAHLDPHFLFNTLNAIAEWCRDDPAVAERATLELAAMLRAMLEGIRAPTWSLASELALASRLFALYEIRDLERFRFELALPDPLPDVELPPMLFLPLFENAITHGPSKGRDGEVRVTIETSDERIELRIENPGAFAGRREGGQGIDMVERRLALAYADRARLSFTTEDDRTITRVSLPRAPLAREALR